MSRIVQMTTLGSNGRFGNQLFQYAFIRTYAERIGATLETPAWIGQRLFGLNDPPPSRKLPHLGEQAISGDPNQWKPDVDIIGWFQRPQHTATVSKSDVLRWFTFKPEWLARYPKKRPRYAACHLRQGDFPTDPGRYCLIPHGSYQRAVVNYALGLPVIWVEENTPEIDSNLPQDLAFLPDFMTILKADILFRSNSTFAWWAGEIGFHEAVYSPRVEMLHGPNDVIFVPGNQEQHAPFEGYGPLRFGRP